MLNQVIIIAEIFLGEKTYQLLCLRTGPSKKQLSSRASPAVLDSWLRVQGNLNQPPLCKLKPNQEMEIQQIKFKPFFSSQHKTQNNSHAFGRQGKQISKFKASLVYKVSSRTARTIQRSPVLKKQKQKQKSMFKCSNKIFIIIKIKLFPKRLDQQIGSNNFYNTSNNIHWEFLIILDNYFANFPRENHFV